MQYSQPIPLGWGEKQSSPMKIEIYSGEIFSFEKKKYRQKKNFENL